MKPSAGLEVAETASTKWENLPGERSLKRKKERKKRLEPAAS